MTKLSSGILSVELVVNRIFRQAVPNLRIPVLRLKRNMVRSQKLLVFVYVG